VTGCGVVCGVVVCCDGLLWCRWCDLPSVTVSTVLFRARSLVCPTNPRLDYAAFVGTPTLSHPPSRLLVTPSNPTCDLRVSGAPLLPLPLRTTIGRPLFVFAMRRRQSGLWLEVGGQVYGDTHRATTPHKCGGATAAGAKDSHHVTPSLHLPPSLYHLRPAQRRGRRFLEERPLQKRQQKSV